MSKSSRNPLRKRIAHRALTRMGSIPCHLAHAYCASRKEAEALEESHQKKSWILSRDVTIHEGRYMATWPKDTRVTFSIRHGFHAKTQDGRVQEFDADMVRKVRMRDHARLGIDPAEAEFDPAF